MYLKPCRNCPHKDGCELKAERLASLRGLGFTSANFKCDKRLSLLQPGQRIELELLACDPTDRIQGEETHTATVMRARKTRILIWLDEETCRGRNPIAVSPDRVTPIEGKVELCSECGQPTGTKPIERTENRGNLKYHSEWDCWKCEGRPDPCVEWNERDPEY